jgi:recombinational DNA repair protein RecR
MTQKEAKEGLECKTYDEIEKQKSRIHALERALKMAGHNITCWACKHIGRSDFCNKCDNSFSNWSFNQKVFEKEE